MATNLDTGKLQLYSENTDIQKIQSQGSQTISVPNSNPYRATYTFNHGMPYVPIVKLWVTNDDGDLSECYSGGMVGWNDHTNGGKWVNAAVYYYVTATQVIITVVNTSPPPGVGVSVDVYWRIYKDAA